MLQQIAIDSLTFAFEERFLAGQVALVGLDRLRSLLEHQEGVIEFELSGCMGEKGEPMLHLLVRGQLPLQCQRCLRTLDFQLVVNQFFELRDKVDDVALTQDDLEDDTRDYLPASRFMNVVALVEDEALLALPVVARHDSCRLPEQEHRLEAASPFGLLLGLKGRTGKTH